MSRPPKALPLEAWPSGTDNAPLAHLATTAAELDASASIPFYNVDGDHMAVVEVDDVSAWLVEFPGGRVGTTVLAPEHGIDEQAVLEVLLRYLGINNDAVEWRRWDSL